MAITRHYLGNTITLTAPIKTASGGVFDLTGCALTWTLRKPGDANGIDANAVIQLTWTDGGASDGIAVATPSSGIAVITLSAARSAALLALDRRYPHDLRVTDAGSVVTTVGVGALDIVPLIDDAAEDYTTLADVRARLDNYQDKDAAAISAMITAASRAIDAMANRRFYQLTETRTFTAERNSYLEVDDLVSITSLSTDISGTRVWDTTWAVTDYDLTPDNAAGIGFPYTAIRQRPFTSRWFPTLRKAVQVSGVWGWPFVPDDIVEATILQTTRLFARRGSPYGVAGQGDFGRIIVPRFDPDVMALVAPYVKHSIGAV